MFRRHELVGIGIASRWDVSRHVFQVRCGDHGYHTGSVTGGCRLYRRDRGMGVGTAQHHGVQHVRQHHVVDKLALTGKQAVVFEPS